MTDESDASRRRAQREGRSMQEVSREAVGDHIELRALEHVARAFELAAQPVG